MQRLVQFLEMIRFSHTIFALPFALLAAAMAYRVPSVTPMTSWTIAKQLTGIILCMIFARSAAMGFNRIADRDVDADNPRTEKRHLPAGKLILSEVKLFTWLAAAGFVASTAIFLPNWLPLALAVPVLVFLLMYSYTKRFTSYTHFYLGIALMLSPICAWIALRGADVIASPAELLPVTVLGLAVALWVAGFDIIYACQDEVFDRETQLNSVPVRFGTVGALRLAALCHLGMTLMLVLLPFVALWTEVSLGLGGVYWFGIVLVGGLLLYEHSVVRPDDLTRVNIAFFNMNAVISVGLLVVCLVDLWWI